MFGVAVFLPLFSHTAKALSMNHMLTYWGPATHDPEHPASSAALQQALDLRDAAGVLPEDN